jgi:hypothetical protein
MAQLTPVHNDSASAVAAASADSSYVARDERRNSGSMSLFSNFWSNNSSTVSLHHNRSESLDDNAGVNHSAVLNLLTTSTYVPRFRHRTTKSTSSRVSLSSQPVLVRAYTGGDRSRTPSVAPSHRVANTMRSDALLPPVEAFKFDGILRAVEPDIEEAIDGIAQLMAQSSLSLAGSHGAHMPPLGEITHPRVRQSGLAIRTTGLERTLTTVAEASSSSERLAGESRAGSTTSGKGKMTAYGSLRSIMSKGKSPEDSPPAGSTSSNRMLPTAWGVPESLRPPFLLKSHSSASMSLATVTELPTTTTVTALSSEPIDSSTSLPQATSASPWLLWRRPRSSTATSSQHMEPANAESALKKVLSSKGPNVQDAG